MENKSRQFQDAVRTFRSTLIEDIVSLKEIPKDVRDNKALYSLWDEGSTTAQDRQGNGKRVHRPICEATVDDGTRGHIYVCKKAV